MENIVVEKLYNKYLYLVKSYASKIKINDMAYERSDLEQELSLKLHNAILKHIEKTKTFNKTGCEKPIPLKFYIITAIKNRAADLLKPHQNHIFTNNFGDIDIGVNSGVNVNIYDCVIEDIDLCHGLNKVEKACFKLYLTGHTKQNIRKIFGKNVNVIEQQKEILKKNKNLLDIYKNNDSKKVIQYNFL